MKKILTALFCLAVYPVICFADFTDNGDGTITDNDTGLMWMQTTGDTDNDGDVDNDDKVTWENALLYCENLNYATYSDWRLPNNKELQSIVDYAEYDPTIDTTIFPDTFSVYYWSSTTYVDYPDNAWAVYFYYGYVYGKPKTDKYFVRAVRGNP